MSDSQESVGTSDGVGSSIRGSLVVGFKVVPCSAFEESFPKTLCAMIGGDGVEALVVASHLDNSEELFKALRIRASGTWSGKRMCRWRGPDKRFCRRTQGHVDPDQLLYIVAIG